MIMLTELHILSLQKSLLVSKLRSDMRNLQADLEGFEHFLKLHSSFWITVHFLGLLLIIRFLKGTMTLEKLRLTFKLELVIHQETLTNTHEQAEKRVKVFMSPKLFYFPILRIGLSRLSYLY